MLKEIKKNRNKIGLMGSWLINDILCMFLNVFMVAYFVKLTNYNYKIISIYYIMAYLFISITFFAIGKIVKNITQIHIYRLGILLNSIYILIIALLKDNIVNYCVLLGIMFGIVQGLYWLASHTLINEYVGNKSNSFISIKSILDKILKILFPIIFGVSIELTSFTYIAYVVLILTIIQILFSLLIKDEEAVSNKKYNFKKFFLKYKNHDALKQCCIMCGCGSSINVLLDTLITILIVMTFKTTISLGFLNTLFSICSIISVYIFNKKIKNKKNAILFATIGLILSILLIVFKVDKFTIIIYNLSAGLFLIILKNIADAKRFVIIDKIQEAKKDYLVEYHTLVELYVNLTRIFAYIILFISSFFNSMAPSNILLIILTILIYIYYKMITNLNNN